MPSGFNSQVLGNEIRSHKVAEQVSHMAAIPYVRAFTLKNQHELASGQSIVIDGRDIGTVVFPEAHHKFFLNAAPEVRAQRRWEELRGQGQRLIYRMSFIMCEIEIKKTATAL